MDKAAIRAHYRTIRLGLDPKSRQHADTAIASRCLELLATLDGVIVSYASLPALGEVDTHHINYHVRNRVIIVPPDPHAVAPVVDPAIIVVPVVSFDQTRHRLGMGGGWYDRYIARHPHALTVGLAYDATYSAELLPHEPTTKL